MLSLSTRSLSRTIGSRSLPHQRLKISCQVILRAPQIFGTSRLSCCKSSQCGTLALKRSFSTSPTTVKKKRTHWERIASWIRYTRIPILVVSVYSLGYQQGVIDCTKTPEALQKEILHSILAATGVKDLKKDVEIVTEGQIRWTSSQRKYQVAAVGSKIIDAARSYVDEKLTEAMKAVKVKLPEDISEEDAMKYYDNDTDVDFWHDARLRLQGEHVQNQPWEYIFIVSPHPNAFVTEILPQRFFITSSMLDVATTADELGMVLGHEVSHLILGHVSQTNQLETMLRTVEVLLLTLDPTSGILALAVIGGLATLRRALSAAHSRENEREADDLGIELAARACFDTQRGAVVMKKMHDASVSLATPSDSSVVRMMDTHPPSLERYEYLKKKSVAENAKYHEECRSVTSRLYSAIWDRGRSSGEPK